MEPERLLLHSSKSKVLQPHAGAVPEQTVWSRLRAGHRPGFVLLEVMVALTVLALVLTPLAAMVFKITSRSHRMVGGSFRNAALLDEVNYLESLPYDSLKAGTATTTVSTGPYPHSRSVVITEVSSQSRGKMKQVALIISPANSIYRSDTMSFSRTKVNKPTLLSEDDQ